MGLSAAILLSGHAAADDKSGVKPSVLSLPSGPGSIEGLGESFEPQLNTGTSSHSIRLKVPAGRAGFAPELTLAYNSGSGNGPFGLGRSVPVPSLQRQTEKGLPRYTDYPVGDGIDNNHNGVIDEYEEFDTYLFSNGEELVPMADGSFRFETEGEFVRFERSGAGWIARRRDGITLRLGIDPAARVQTLNGKTFRWCLQEMEDTHGNKIAFQWSSLDASQQRYLQRIQYNPDSGSGMAIDFVYEARPDVVVDGRGGFLLATGFRCREIVMTAIGQRVRSYRLGYLPTSDTQPLSLLGSVTTVGRDGTSTLPPAEFGYSTFLAGSAVIGDMPSAPSSILNGPNADLLDINADGLPDVLDTSTYPHSYYVNDGPDGTAEVQWETVRYMSTGPSNQLSSPETQLADIDGDGRADLLDNFGSPAQFYRIDTNLNWQLGGYVATAGFSFGDPAVKLVDVNGDKRIDVLKTTSSEFSAWLSLPGDSWSAPFLSVPPDPFATLDRPEVRLADMNGDRVLDLVRLSDGACTYYPSTGLGRFGQGVAVANAPTGILDLSKLFLVDVNGDGLDDAVFLGGGAVTVWINLGPAQIDGTAHFAAPFYAPGSQLADPSTVVRMADVNGNGTRDILWNTYPAEFLEFAPGDRPYLLKAISNGIGGTTTISYGSSIREMVRDRAAGRPWVSPMPISVPVVTAVAVQDGRQATVYGRQYAYHDPYYDPKDKEFRGFAGTDKTEIGNTTEGVPTLVTTYAFDTGSSIKALRGKSLATETKTEAGGTFHRQTNTWSTVSRPVWAAPVGDPRSVIFPIMTESCGFDVELGSGPPMTTISRYQYDDYGNLVVKADYGRVEDLDGSAVIGDSPQDLSAWDDERVVVMSYSSGYPSGLSAWILNRPVQEEVQGENGAVFSRRQHYYDEPSFAGSNLGAVVRGDETMTLDWHDPSQPQGYVKSARKHFDAAGNVTALYDALWPSGTGHYREVAYDSTLSTYPIRETIHTGNPDSAGDSTLFAQVAYDLGWGVANSSIDFNSYTTNYSYDTFGRLTGIAKPGDSAALPTVGYSYVLKQDLGGGKSVNWIEERRRETSGLAGTIDSRQFYDGLGRKIMKRSEGESAGQAVASDAVLFNTRGGAYKRYLPYFDSAGVNPLDFREPPAGSAFTEAGYDGPGRAVIEYQPLGVAELSRKFSTTAYLPGMRVEKDENQTDASSSQYGNESHQVFDGLRGENGDGRLQRMESVVRLNDDGTPAATQRTWAYSYRYDPLGNFLGYTDPQQNQSHLVYDGLSRPYFLNDPDHGYSWMAYDAAGNVVRQRDARGQEIALAYDGVNRQTQEYYCTPSENTGNGLTAGTRWTSPSSPPLRQPDVTYHYDFPSGPVTTGEGPATPLPSQIGDVILERAASQPGFDLTGDGLVDVADLVATVNRHAFPVHAYTAVNTLGALGWVADLSGQSTLSYDARGRNTDVIRRIHRETVGDFATYRTARVYDAADRVSTQTFPDGTIANYGYNARGLLQSISGAVAGVTYNPAGEVAGELLACGVQTQREFDARLRPSTLQSQRLADGSWIQKDRFGYDSASNPTSILDERSTVDLGAIAADLSIDTATGLAFQGSVNLAYDDMNRIVQAANPSVFGNVSYRYDRVGNLGAKNASVVAPSSALDLDAVTNGGLEGAWYRDGRSPGSAAGAHAMSSTESGGVGPGGLTLVYDGAGNRVSKAQKAYSWDARNRLTQIVGENATERFTYGFDGEWRFGSFQPELSTAKSRTLYVAEDVTIRDEELEKCVFVAGNRVACGHGRAIEGGAFSADTFLLGDLMSSTVASLGLNGQVQRYLDYGPYGEVRLERAMPEARRLPYRFLGKESTRGDTLYRLGARYLDFSSGAFLSVDPILLSDGGRRWPVTPGKYAAYRYCRSNPFVWSDPTGLDEKPGRLDTMAGTAVVGLANIGAGALSISEGLIASVATGGAAAPVGLTIAASGALTVLGGVMRTTVLPLLDDEGRHAANEYIGALNQSAGLAAYVAYAVPTLFMGQFDPKVGLAIANAANVVESVALMSVSLSHAENLSLRAGVDMLSNSGQAASSLQDSAQNLQESSVFQPLP